MEWKDMGWSSITRGGVVKDGMRWKYTGRDGTMGKGCGHTEWIGTIRDGMIRHEIGWHDVERVKTVWDRTGRDWMTQSRRG